MQGCNLDSALASLNIILKRYYINPKNKSLHQVTVKALCNMGNVYTTLGRYEKAYESLATGIAIAEENGIEEELQYLYNNMGGLWNASGLVLQQDGDSANKWLARAYWKAVECGNAEELPAFVDNLLAHGGKNLFIAEIKDYKSRRLPNTPSRQYTDLSIKAMELEERGRIKEADSVLLMAARLMREKDRLREMGAELKAARLRVRHGEFASARQLLRHVMSTSDSIGAIEYHVLALNLLAGSLSSENIKDSADYYAYEWYKAREALRDANTHGVANVQLSKRVEKINDELKQMSLRKQKREKQLIWAIGLGLLIIVVTLWVIQANRAQRRYIAELYAQNLKLLKSQPIQQGSEKTKYQTSSLDAATTDELYCKIIAEIEKPDNLYNSDFTLAQLSAALGVNGRYVSQTINEKNGCGFPQFINEFRVKEACRRLNDLERYGKLTVEAVGQSVGMSRSTFSRVFKQMTGMTPATYRKQAMKNAEGKNENA